MRAWLPVRRLDWSTGRGAGNFSKAVSCRRNRCGEGRCQTLRMADSCRFALAHFFRDKFTLVGGGIYLNSYQRTQPFAHGHEGVRDQLDGSASVWLTKRDTGDPLMAMCSENEEEGADRMMPPARKHLFNPAEFERMQAASSARRGGSRASAAAAERELERILQRHGSSIAECDAGVMARLDATFGLTAEQVMIAQGRQYDQARSIDKDCPGCQAAQRARQLGGQVPHVALLPIGKTGSRAKPAKQAQLAAPRRAFRPRAVQSSGAIL